MNKDLIAEVKCPTCGRKVKIKLKDMVPGHTKTLSCGCTIQFEGDDGRKMQRAIDDLAKQINRLSANITIKL